MKKSLVFAMAMAMGITASAYAANPFSDVPQGHWAYDSVAELAAAGVVEGYGDGSYGGDKLMTRYEMAQIVAKAMAKGANVDALAAEFADELDSLGVRLTNLEKKTDNVKITGEVRFRYVDQEGPIAKQSSPLGDEYFYIGNKNNHVADIRTRIWLKGQINEDWSYTGMVQNTQNLNNNSGDDTTNLQRAYIDGKIGGTKMTAGRYNMVIADGNIYDTRADGVEFKYGDKVQIRAYAGKMADSYGVLPVAVEVEEGFKGVSRDISTDGSASGGKYLGASISSTLVDGVTLTGGYVQVKEMGTDFDGIPEASEFIKMTNIKNNIFHLGLDYNVGDFNFNATYLKGNLRLGNDPSGGMINTVADYLLDDDGIVVGVGYKGAKLNEKGSWGLWAKYYDQGAQTYIAHTTDANTFGMTGFKGYGIGANYAVAKNAVVNVAYYDTKSKFSNIIEMATGGAYKAEDKRIWTDLTFKF